ncbi:MAG: ABC-F family ATP-binding cassette domain-containing protein [Vicinamibacteria bacterium]|nr:ABC-F family ATP-binding cassette domain-containing protein [Vicinamibacteria bacterium]
MAKLLLSCKDLAKTYGAEPLFDGLSLGVFEGDHVGIVGPNGSGKTTLLRILAGVEKPSSGVCVARKRLRLGYVPQDPGFAPGTTVASALQEAARDERVEEHERQTRIAVAMGKAGIKEGDQPVAELSGGWKKRLAIACALACAPELLLLDEPTNHLDLDGILWLEDLLMRESEAFVAVSHDRYFLEAAAGRMLDLDRAFASGLLDVRGRYSLYLEKKDALLAGQAAYQESLRNRVRGELEWLSRKARARTRKAQARIDSATRLKDELAGLDSRSRSSVVNIEFTGTTRKTKRLLVAERLTKSYGSRAIVHGLDLVLSPGHRLGLLGANGSGKTTLLRILAGFEKPSSGAVEHAPDLRIVMFDQHRSRLDPDVPLKRALAPHGDSVVYQGRAIHVAGWARRFLFRSEQIETPVGRLSGGEQARVLIAKLMLEPADLLLLDEPTNDLDIPTLDVLEESLLEFPGALVLVTHDRYLLDRVSTRVLALDGSGNATIYSDYAQWERDRREAAQAEGAARRKSASLKAAGTRSKKLTYLEQREWEQMEARILEAEKRLAACRQASADPAIASDHEALMERMEALKAAQDAVERFYARWAALEAKRR